MGRQLSAHMDYILRAGLAGQTASIIRAGLLAAGLGDYSLHEINNKLTSLRFRGHLPRTAGCYARSVPKVRTGPRPPSVVDGAPIVAPVRPDPFSVAARLLRDDLAAIAAAPIAWEDLLAWARHNMRGFVADADARGADRGLILASVNAARKANFLPPFRLIASKPGADPLPAPSLPRITNAELGW